MDITRHRAVVQERHHGAYCAGSFDSGTCLVIVPARDAVEAKVGSGILAIGEDEPTAWARAAEAVKAEAPPARNPNAPAGGAIMEDMDHEARTGEKSTASRPWPEYNGRPTPDTYLPVPLRFAPAMRYLNHMAAEIHEDNARWWTDPRTGERIERNVGEMLMLMVSELAEAMEGHRKDLMDDKLPHRKMIEVEMADLLIRALDFAGGLGLDLDGAVAEKRAFNATRADHTTEARLAPGGKRY